MRLARRFLHSLIALGADIIGAPHPGGILRFLLPVAMVQARGRGNGRPNARPRARPRNISTSTGGRCFESKEAIEGRLRDVGQPAEGVPLDDRDAAETRGRWAVWG